MFLSQPDPFQIYRTSHTSCRAHFTPNSKPPVKQLHQSTGLASLSLLPIILPANFFNYYREGDLACYDCSYFIMPLEKSASQAFITLTVV